MAQHFLLSKAAKTLSLGAVFQMKDAAAEMTFRRIRWADTNGEPVIIKPARKQVVSKRLVMRDWIETVDVEDDIKCSITLKRGLTGAKPEAVCHWAFELLGARPEDELADLFPGTGAVSKAWKTWQGKFTLPALQAAE